MHTASSCGKQHISLVYPAYSPRKPVRCGVNDDDREDSMLLIERLKQYHSTGKGTTNGNDAPQNFHSSRDFAGSGKKLNPPHRSAAVRKQEDRKARDSDEKLKGGLTDIMSDEGESNPKKEIQVGLSGKGVRSVSLTIHLDDIEETVTTPMKYWRLG